MKFNCTQHGCEFEADELPEVCPVCNNPQSSNCGDEAPWEDWSMAELRNQAVEWELEGWNSRTTKPDLIALLDAVETEDDI